MPVSKHRRRTRPGMPQPERSPGTPRANITTIEDLRQAIANPGLDFTAKAVSAGLWWYQQLLRKAGDRRASVKASWKDRRRAALLLCVAMDGEHGKNDDLSPVIAEMLRPYCPAPTFAEGWERTNRMVAGAALATAARLVNPSGKPHSEKTEAPD